MHSTLRHPAVAGRFYPGDRAALLEDVQSYLAPQAATPALGCVAPHAGYIYSGAVAEPCSLISTFPSAASFSVPTTPAKDAPSPS